MSITIFGTCRLNYVNNTNNLHNLINYTHSTKEVLQQIHFLLGNNHLPSPFNRLCFRTGINENRPILYSHKFNKLFNDSSICVIEICSDKKYVYNNFYLHHLCVDKRFFHIYPQCSMNTPKNILDNVKCIRQTRDEIENDILEIKKLLEPRKILFVTHYNSKYNGEYIESRNNLIITVREICEKYKIPVINPTEILKDYKQEDIMTEDLGHYTPLGASKFSEYINNYLSDFSRKVPTG
jgi:hypothetical protein